VRRYALCLIWASMSKGPSQQWGSFDDGWLVAALTRIDGYSTLCIRLSPSWVQPSLPQVPLPFGPWIHSQTPNSTVPIGVWSPCKGVNQYQPWTGCVSGDTSGTAGQGCQGGP
jgi:hypothetical protein